MSHDFEERVTKANLGHIDHPDFDVNLDQLKNEIMQLDPTVQDIQVKSEPSQSDTKVSSDQTATPVSKLGNSKKFMFATAAAIVLAVAGVYALSNIDGNQNQIAEEIPTEGPISEVDFENFSYPQECDTTITLIDGEALATGNGECGSGGWKLAEVILVDLKDDDDDLEATVRLEPLTDSSQDNDVLYFYDYNSGNQAVSAIGSTLDMPIGEIYDISTKKAEDTNKLELHGVVEAFYDDKDGSCAEKVQFRWGKTDTGSQRVLAIPESKCE